MNLEPKLYPLGNFITLYGGGTPSKDRAEYWGTDIPWATVKDLKQPTLVETIDSISELGLRNSSSKMVKAGSIILATRMAVGRVVIAGIDVAINQDLKAIGCSDKIDVSYLFYLLSSKESYFNRVASGATVKGIKINHITDMEIPLPSLEGQKKIAAILDAVDALRQKDAQLIEKYNALSQSLFLDMFGDPVTNPMGWERVSLNKLCSFQKNTILPQNIKDKTKYLALEGVEKETGNIISVEIVNAGEIKSNKFAFNENYILYGKLRPYLNKVANPTFEGICSTEIIPIEPLLNKTNKQFITSILRSKGFVKFADESCSGANLPRISPKKIQAYSTVNPPINLQNKFAERIQHIEAQKQQAQAALQKSEDLFNSLLQRAFKGELTA